MSKDYTRIATYILERVTFEGRFKLRVICPACGVDNFIIMGGNGAFERFQQGEILHRKADCCGVRYKIIGRTLTNSIKN